jgi:hypothetical protein
MAMFGAVAVTGVNAGAQTLFTTQQDFTPWTLPNGGATLAVSANSTDSGATASVDGVGNDNELTGISNGGTAGTSGSLTLTNYTAGNTVAFVPVLGPEEVPEAGPGLTPLPNAAFFTALGTSGVLSVDFTEPVGGTVGTYFEAEILFNDSVGYQQQGLVSVGHPATAAGVIIDDGTTINGGEEYTLEQNYTLVNAPAGDLYSYFQLGVVFNSDWVGGTITLDNLRIASSVTSVPEPTTMALLPAAALMAMRRRRSAK